VLQPVGQWLDDLRSARALAEADRLDEAGEAYRRLLGGLRQRLGTDSAQVRAAVTEYAGVLEARGEYAAAASLLEEVLKVESALPPSSALRESSGRAWDLARVLAEAGEGARAVAVLREHFGAWSQAPDPLDHFGRARALLEILGGEGEWSSPAMRAFVWGLADAMPTGLIVWAPDPIEKGAWFELARWDGRPPAANGAAAAVRVAAGTLVEARAVRDVPPGLYRLTLELPRHVGPAVRREAWVLFGPWDVRRYHLEALEVEAWEAVKANSHPPLRPLAALVVSEGVSAYPGPAGARHDFALVATARVTLPAGAYRFSATSDDGVRVWVDGRHVTGNWTGRPTTTDAAVATLEDGEHELKVEYFDGWGDFSLWLEVIPVAPGRPTDPGAAGSLVWQLCEVSEQLALSGESGPRLSSRGHLLARLGRLPEADADFERAIKISPSEFTAWLGQAALLVAAGDAAAHREYCLRMLQRLGNHPDPAACHRVAHAALMGPGPAEGPALDKVQALLERATGNPALQRYGANQAYIAVSRGALAYRRGDYAEAARLLEDTLERSDAAGLRGEVELFWAMACHRLGRHEEAVTHLERGTRFITENIGNESVDARNGWFGTAWTLHAEAQAPAREAESLIQAPSGAPKTASATRPSGG
jgi:tetratricopeptide (TPR) repeat protein